MELTLATELGVAAQDGMTATEAIAQHEGMNWNPTIVQSGYEDGGAWHKDEGTRHVLRSDTRAPLGTVSPNYSPISVMDAMSIADSLGGQICGCGEYEGGALQWMQIRLNDNAHKIVGDDVVEEYMLIVTGHAGKGSLIFKMTPIRVWCKNTLYAAMKGKTKASGSIRHSGNTDAKISLAREMLKQAGLFFRDAAEAFTFLAKTHVTQNTAEGYFRDVAGVKPQHIDMETGELSGRPATMVDRYLNAYHGVRGGADKVRGTLWGAYNAVTFVQDHVLVEEKNSKTKHKSAHDRAAYQYFESGPKVGLEAFDTAQRLAVALN